MLAAALIAGVLLQARTGTAQTCVPAPTASPSPTATTSPSPTPTPTLPDLPTQSSSPVAATAGGPMENQETPGTGGDPCPSKLTISVTPTWGVYGKTFTITGNLECGGYVIRSSEVNLERTLHGESRWHPITMEWTNDDGDVSFIDKPTRNAVYRLTWKAGDEDQKITPAEMSGVITCRPAESSVIRVSVSPGVLFNTTANATPRRGQTVSFGGSALPGHPGHKVHLQALLNNKWTNVSTRTLDARSGYAFAYRRTTAGTIVFRVAYPTQHSDHSWNVSRMLKVTWR